MSSLIEMSYFYRFGSWDLYSVMSDVIDVTEISNVLHSEPSFKSYDFICFPRF